MRKRVVTVLIVFCSCKSRSFQANPESLVFSSATQEATVQCMKVMNQCPFDQKEDFVVQKRFGYRAAINLKYDFGELELQVNLTDFRKGLHPDFLKNLANFTSWKQLSSKEKEFLKRIDSVQIEDIDRELTNLEAKYPQFSSDFQQAMLKTGIGYSSPTDELLSFARQVYLNRLQKIYRNNSQELALVEQSMTKLKHSYSRFWAQSVFFSVRKRSTGEIQAVVRFVRAPYGRRIERSEANVVIADNFGNWGNLFRFFSEGPDSELGKLPLESHPEYDPQLMPRALLPTKTHWNRFRRILSGQVPSGSYVVLPMEETLRILLPRDAVGKSVESSDPKNKPYFDPKAKVEWSMGEIVEVGLFAKRRGSTEEVNLLLWKGILAFLLEPNRLGYETANRNYFMYTMSPEYFQNLGFQTTGTIQTFDSKNWTVFRMSTSEWYDSYRKLFRKEPTELKKIELFFQALSESMEEEASRSMLENETSEADSGAHEP